MLNADFSPVGPQHNQQVRTMFRLAGEDHILKGYSVKSVGKIQGDTAAPQELLIVEFVDEGEALRFVTSYIWETTMFVKAIMREGAVCYSHPTRFAGGIVTVIGYRSR